MQNPTRGSGYIHNVCEGEMLVMSQSFNITMKGYLVMSAIPSQKGGTELEWLHKKIHLSQDLIKCYFHSLMLIRAHINLFWSH